MRFIVTAIASVFTVAEAQQCGQQQCGQQNCGAVVPTVQGVLGPAVTEPMCNKDKNCCPPPVPEVGNPPKPTIKQHNSYVLKKIHKQEKVLEPFYKKTVVPDELIVPCMIEHEAYIHDHKPCRQNGWVNAEETVKKVSWDVELVRERITLHKKVKLPIRLLLEKELPSVQPEFILTRKPVIKNNPDVKVKCCTKTLEPDLLPPNDEDCQLEPEQPEIMIPAPPPAQCGGCATGCAAGCAAGGCVR